MNVYVFNPDSDLSLAHEAEHRRKGLPRAVYTAKPFARRMARSLQLLPCWYASPGDAVLVDGPDEQAARWQRWADERGLRVTIVNAPPSGDVTYRPWGWCNTVVHRLLARGAAAAQLPLAADGLLPESFAALASRRVTVTLHRLIAERLGHRPCPGPRVVTAGQRGDLEAMRHSGFYLKKLYSGSGQGIYHQSPTDGPLPPELWQWLDGELRRQGAVMLEPQYDRIMDMAVEYLCEAGTVEADGFSMFNVDRHDQWKSTMVDRRDAIHDVIVGHYPAFDTVVDAVTATLRDIVPQEYVGHIGVDLLLYRDADGIVGINPCVELNFRTTMGVVAAHLGERHGMRGTLRIVPADGVPPGATLLTPADAGSTLAIVTPSR